MIDIESYSNQIANIFEYLQDKTFEYGGAIKKDGFICQKGDLYAVKADYLERFTWHYHPNGVLKFSNNDYFCFMASEARISALFTKDFVAIYEKTESQNSFKTKLISELTGAQCLKGLFYMKALKTFNKFFSCNLNEDSEEAILRKLKVSKTVYNRELQQQ